MQLARGRVRAVCIVQPLGLKRPHLSACRDSLDIGAMTILVPECSVVGAGTWYIANGVMR